MTRGYRWWRTQDECETSTVDMWLWLTMRLWPLKARGVVFFPYSNGRENLVDVYVAHWGAGKGKRSVRFDKPVLMDRVVINRSAKTSAWSLATVGRPAGTWNDPQQTQESDFSQLAMSVYKGCSYIFPSDPNQNPRKKHHHQSLSWLWITFINHC